MPWVAVGTDAVVTASGTVTTRDIERLPLRTGVPLSVATTVTVEVAAVVGVPEISPVVLSIDSPAGRPVAVQV